ncbi:fimbria/pilus outer membrane usher protein [Neorhizobium sp. NCHU2750]|uniref:fimbria/pilus outer membrane usher protein n=1 Tax=Neorhizobium sp. NCHU2750 TaxID=1825976 RepID=UPI000E736876|nr:fimbrial usher protein [Neorhizobium sp. NCHU2750]
MQGRNPREADRRLVFALAAMLAFGAAPSFGRAASADPAAQPAGMALDLQLEVIVNGNPSGFIAAFRKEPDGRLTIEAEQLENCGIHAAREARNGEGRIDIGRLPGVSFLLDEAMQTVTFTAEPKSLATRRISVAAQVNGDGAAPDGGEEKPRLKPTSSPGALLNYTFFGSTGGEGLSSLWDLQGVSASFDARLFGPLGVFGSSQIVALSANDRYSTVRLDTSWSYSDTDRMLTYKAGDLISGALGWTRPVRLGGVQIQRNFDLRPDIITMPLPELSGTAAVPSTVDLYVDDARRSSYDLPAGPFTLSNIPAITGNATARLVVRDALGRETVTETPLYVSADLLSTGFFDYSAELGFARQNYGTSSFSYDERLIGLVTGRYGVTDRLTLEGHLEGGMDYVNGGFGAAVELGSFGLGTAAVAASRFGAEQGYLASVSVEGEFWDVHWRASSQRTFGDYNDAASVTADRAHGIPASRNGPPKALDQLNLSVPLKFDETTLNFSMTHVVSADDERSRIVGVTANRSIGENGNMFVTAYADLDHSDAIGLFAGLTWSFGNDLTVSTGMTRDDEGISVSSSVAKKIERGGAEWDLRASDVEGARTSRAASIARQGASGRVEGYVEQTDRTVQARGQIEGSLVVAGGDVFVTDRIDDAFAIVDAGAPDVDVQFENRPAGRTNARGRLLVPDLRSYEANNLSIDPSNLPINSAINSTREEVMPQRGGGVVVRFDVASDVAAALATLRTEDDVFVETGSVISLEGTDQTFVIGYDGQAYITGQSGHLKLSVQQPTEGTCTAEIDIPKQEGAVATLPEVICKRIQ